MLPRPQAKALPIEPMHARGVSFRMLRLETGAMAWPFFLGEGSLPSWPPSLGVGRGSPVPLCAPIPDFPLLPELPPCPRGPPFPTFLIFPSFLSFLSAPFSPFLAQWGSPPS